MSYEDHTRRDRRLTILRFLEAVPQYTSNVSVLTDVCNRHGVISTRDQVTTELHWLAEQGFVALTGDDGFLVVVATGRGVEIAMGRATHPDIKRPWAR